jgi:hypothetical protein
VSARESTEPALIGRISDEQRLLLEATLKRDGRARVAWREWREAVALEEIDNDSLRLLPLLARRFDDLEPADPVRQVVRGVYRKAWVQNQLLVRRAAEVVEHLAAAEIPVVILKGASLIRYFDGDWGARPMYDVDILVPTPRVVEALEIVEGIGWNPEQAVTPAWIRWRELPRAHACGFTLRDDEQLDLHWHVMSGSIGPHADDEFWAAAVPLQVGPLRARALSDPDLLLHLLVHGGVSGPTTPLVQWVADATLVLRAIDVTTVGERLVHQARSHSAVGVVTACLEAIVELLDDEQAARLLPLLQRTQPSLPERLIRLTNGRADRPPARAAAEFARHGGGTTRVGDALLALARDRLDLDLCRRRAFGLAYGLSLRAPVIERIARAVDGSYARTPSEDPPALTIPVALDLTSAGVLDQYGGPGWGRAGPNGSSTKGGESRLVLPIPDLGPLPLVMEFEVTARVRPLEVDVLVNGHRETRVWVGMLPSVHRVTMRADPSSARRPVEVAFRSAHPVRGPRASHLYVRRLTIAGAGSDSPANPRSP